MEWISKLCLRSDGKIKKGLRAGTLLNQKQQKQELNLAAKSYGTADRQRAQELLVNPPSLVVALPMQHNHMKCLFPYLRVIPTRALNGFNTGISSSGPRNAPWTPAGLPPTIHFSP